MASFIIKFLFIQSKYFLTSGKKFTISGQSHAQGFGKWNIPFLVSLSSRGEDMKLATPTCIALPSNSINNGDPESPPQSFPDSET